MIPALAFAMLVVGLAIALVVDRLWLDAARVELTAAAEAAALAAAGRVADDALLKPDADLQPVLEAARQKAVEVAAGNQAAGSPVTLNPAEEGDIRFGRLIRDGKTGKPLFLETESRPTSVVVFAERTHGRGNPVALFFRQLTGQTAGNLIVSAEATIDNRIAGVRPYQGANTPAIPLALLDKHLDPKRLDTWTLQIDGRAGSDDFGFDAATGEVTPGGDGIPEMLIYGAPQQAKEEDVQKANCHLADIGTGLQPDAVARQFDEGWSHEDLADFGDELRTDEGPQSLDSNAILTDAETTSLEGLVGQARICLLYANPRSVGSTGECKIEATRLVAVRILNVRPATKKSVEILVQPAVVTTRTALLSEPDPAWSPDPGVSYDTNPYIYKLFLTQ